MPTRDVDLSAELGIDAGGATEDAFFKGEPEAVAFEKGGGRWGRSRCLFWLLGLRRLFRLKVFLGAHQIGATGWALRTAFGLVALRAKMQFLAALVAVVAVVVDDLFAVWAFHSISSNSI
jgi:hypothetical protein